jgi:hypothetical protein
MIYRLIKDGPDFKQLPLNKHHIVVTSTNSDLNKDNPAQTPSTSTNDVVTTNKRVDNE